MLLHKAIVSLASIADTDPHYLRATANVAIQADGSAVATDGKMLVCLTGIASDSAEYPKAASGAPRPDLAEAVAAAGGALMIPPASLKAAVKALPRKCCHPTLGDNVAVDAVNGSVTLTAGDVGAPSSVSFRTVEGTYPNVAAVTPAVNLEAFRICFDPQLMRDICDAVLSAAKVRGLPTDVVLQMPDVNTKVMRLDFAGGHALLMPKRMPVGLGRVIGERWNDLAPAADRAQSPARNGKAPSVKSRATK